MHLFFYECKCLFTVRSLNFNFRIANYGKNFENKRGKFFISIMSKIFRIRPMELKLVYRR